MNIRNILDAMKLKSTRGRRQRNFIGVETLEVRQLLAADISVLKDIMPGPGSSQNFNTFEEAPVEYNGLVYFGANDGIHGSELWRTDGTETGTELYADVVPGPIGSLAKPYTVVNGRLLFTTSTAGGVPTGLWATDGTESGTIQLAALTFVTFVGTANGNAFFQTGNGSNNIEIVRTDGTAAGTTFIAAPLALGIPTRVTAFDGSVFVEDGNRGYRIDEVTTSLVKLDANNNAANQFTVVGSSLYFTGHSNSTGDGLFRLDSATGQPVFLPGIPRGQSLSAAGNLLFFYAMSPQNELALWKSDGTAAGTSILMDPFPLRQFGNVRQSIEIDGVYFASIYDDHSNYGLVRSDGTVAGTMLLGDFNPGFGFLTEWNGKLLFPVRTNSSTPTSEIWTSDGSVAGTTRLASVGQEYLSRLIRLQNSFIYYEPYMPGPDGKEIKILRIGDAPGAPVIANMAATTTSQRPTISWSPDGTNTDYDVWINNRSTREYRKIHQAVAGTSFVPPIDLGIGNVSAWVRTAGTATNPPSAWSSAVSFRILASVTQNDVALDNDKQPILSWVSQSGAAKYEVHIDRLDVPVTQVFRDATITGTSLKLTTLPLNGRYRVWVRGITADGTTGGWSAPKEFVARHVPVFTNSLNPTLDTSPTLTWTAVPGATTYDLYVVKIAGYVNVLNLTNITGTTTTLPSLPAGQYRYWVRVTGAPAWSNPVDLNTNGRTTVITPSGATTTNLPVISWQSVVDATGYDIQVDQIGGKPKYIYAENRTGTSANAAPLANKNFVVAGNYRVWIRARNATTIGSWSPAVDFVVPNLQTEVLTPTGSVSPAQAFPITWRPIQGATSYQVLVYWLGVQQNYIKTSVSGAATSYTRATPLPAGNYRVWVKAIVPGSIEIYSDPVDFAVV